MSQQLFNNLTYGSDPEYFIRNIHTNKIVSSIPIVVGTKERPESLGDGYFILQDNILAEGNIPPASSKMSFLFNMSVLEVKMNEYIQSKYPTLEIYSHDCLDIDMAFLSHPDAMQFGCSPYMNAWDNKIHRANDLSAESFRTCGFHIHIGYDLADGNKLSRESINQIITRAFDIFVIIPSCKIFVDHRRFENYGGLGQYRDTSYGLECRSLGGMFIRKEYISWVFDQLQKALEFANDEENAYKLLYSEKPVVKFESKEPTINLSIYENLKINFNEQLIRSNKTIYA